MGSERAYPRLGQAILLVAVLLGASIIEGIVLDVAGVGGATVSGAELTLTVLTYLVVLRWAWRRTGRPWRAVFRFQPVRAILFLPLLLMTVGFSITASEVDNLLRVWLPLPAVFRDILRDLMRPEALSILYVGLVAPVFEELLFRGLILQGFLQHYGRRTVMLASAVLFAVSHGNPIQAFPALTVGVIYAWLRIRSGSLWPCLVAHSLNNSLVWMLSVLLPVRIPGYTLPTSGFAVGEFQPLWFDLLGMLALIVGLMGLAKTLPSDLLEVRHQDASVSGSVPRDPDSSCAAGNTADKRDRAGLHA